jgi:D-alanyl-D-alanine carboxypeptidase (penicillin-binding protein 5/6)
MTARELALIARHIVQDLSKYYHYYSEREYTWNNIKQQNRNPLLYMDIGVDGLKTGYTEESGYGLVASAERDGRRLILVVNGIDKHKDRAPEARKLLDWGFRAFKSFVLFDPGEEVGTASVWGGEKGEVRLITKKQATVSLRRMARSGIKAQIVYDGPLRAPVVEGAEVARLRVTAPDHMAQELPLYAAESVAEGGFTRKAIDALGSLVLGRVEF